MPSGDKGPRIEAVAGELTVGVRVNPSAARTAFQGVYGDRLKVSLTAPAEDNRANRSLEETLAAWLDVPRADIHIKTGHASRDKVVAFAGIGEAELREKLGSLMRSRLQAR